MMSLLIMCRVMSKMSLGLPTGSDTNQSVVDDKSILNFGFGYCTIYVAKTRTLLDARLPHS